MLLLNFKFDIYNVIFKRKKSRQKKLLKSIIIAFQKNFFLQKKINLDLRLNLEALTYFLKFKLKNIINFNLNIRINEVT